MYFNSKICYNNHEKGMIKMKKVLVTGRTSGIGLALVQKYLDNNYDVYATYCHSLDCKIAQVKYIHLDLNNKDSIDSLIKEIPDLDILICNAGICNDDDLK